MPIILGVIILIIAVGTIGWLLVSEKQQQPLDPQQNASRVQKNSVTTSEILSRVGLQNPAPAAPRPQLSNLLQRVPFLNKILPKRPSLNPNTDSSSDKPEQIGTASLRLDQIPPEENQGGSLNEMKQELESKITELTDRNTKIELLLKEKSDLLAKLEKDLNNELKTHKEFNKVKDILEKDLKDTKEKGRKLQVDLTSVQNEAETYTKRILQLEEKVKALELEIHNLEELAQQKEEAHEKDRQKIKDLEARTQERDEAIQQKDQKISLLIEKFKQEGRGEEAPSSSEGLHLSADIMEKVNIQESEPLPSEKLENPVPSPSEMPEPTADISDQQKGDDTENKNPEGETPPLP